MAHNKYNLKTTLSARKTYRFILSCDHDNIETILLSQYRDIYNIVTSLLFNANLKKNDAIHDPYICTYFVTANKKLVIMKAQHSKHIFSSKPSKMTFNAT